MLLRCTLAAQVFVRTACAADYTHAMPLLRWGFMSHVMSPFTPLPSCMVVLLAIAWQGLPDDVARFLCFVLACASSFTRAAMAAFGLAIQFQHYGYTGSSPAAYTLPSAALRLA